MNNSHPPNLTHVADQPGSQEVPEAAATKPTARGGRTAIPPVNGPVLERTDRPALLLLPAICTALCALFTAAGLWLRGSPLSSPLLLGAYASGGLVPLGLALRKLAERRVGVELLMVLAAAGTAVIGDLPEGAVLLFLFAFSGTLEAYALYRTRSSIRALIKLRPRETMRVRDGREECVPVETLGIGDVVRVRPGERYPVDGQVIEGETWADEATITGESTPVQKGVGSWVFAGTINGRGSVLVRMERAVADTTLERIVRLVQEAQAEKAPSQKLVESWQQPYVLTVLVASTLVFAVSWFFEPENAANAFYHAMVLLVVASPCAVVVASPAVVLSAIARAARHGVLIKGGYPLEVLGSAETMAFDKTGTITLGRPGVSRVWAMGASPDQALRLAAAVERRSEHHLAEAVLEDARRRAIDVPDAEDFDTHTGLGVHARVEGRWVGVGREALFETHGVPVPPGARDAARACRDSGDTALIVVSGEAAGVIGLADQPRPEAAAALAKLRQLGIRRLLILTGDHERVARAVAERVGADEVHAGLLPEQKVVELHRLMAGGHRVAMVGDGINDAPALSTASVGIAMGGAGTDVALEVADVVLMRDDLTALPFAVWLGRRARRRILQNLALALGMIAVLIFCAPLGLPLWIGVIGHEGSTLLVVLNGLRMLTDRDPESHRRRKPNGVHPSAENDPPTRARAPISTAARTVPHSPDPFRALPHPSTPHTLRV